MLEGVPPMTGNEPYQAAKRVADGFRPSFHSKNVHPGLKE